MNTFVLIVYFLVGFCIARSMKDNAPDESTGLERFAWFLFWPILYVKNFVEWIMETFTD